jgi:hypothetical protein
MQSIDIIIYTLVACIILTSIWAIRTELRLKKFIRGKNAKSLEETLLSIVNNLDRNREKQKEVDARLETIENKIKKSVRSVETVRFNPFPDQGSNQSFASSFINDEGDGVVISSLFARDRMSVFAKPIKDGKSTFELTDEEKEVLEKTLRK